MKANIYISLKPKTDAYIYIENMYHENEIEDSFDDHVQFSKDCGMDKTESFEGFKLVYLYLENVEFDGRIKKITDKDVLQTLEKQGYAIATGNSTIFGEYYKPTEKLINQLNEQLAKRKQLINEGKHVNLKEIA